MLPDGSGDDLCRRVVAGGASTKVLMLTARDAVAERVAGLDLGADDYVTKPVGDDGAPRARPRARPPPWRGPPVAVASP